MRQASQTQVVGTILEVQGKIENFETISDKLSLRLAARIHELRQRGWKIHTQRQRDRNCVYTLIKLPKRERKVRR